MVGGARSTAVALVGGALVLLGPALVIPAASATSNNESAHVRSAAVVDLASSSSTTTAKTKTTTRSKNKPRPPRPKTTEVGRSVFWECKEKSTEVLVALNSLTLHVGTPLTINFVVRNTGSTPCNYVAPSAGETPGPTAAALQAGPCGSIGFDVVGPGKHNVWPGPAAFNCPALGFAELQPGASVSGSGTWAENKVGSTAHVAAGHYTLVVDGHFRFPITVSG